MSIYEPYKIEVLRDGIWLEVDHMEIKKGDRFRIYYSDGTSFFYDFVDEVEFCASCEPYFDAELGVWFVRVE